MILSNCPDARLRNPRRAAELAEKAVEIEPQVSNHWTALGIARYREGQWQEARTAFDKSLQLGTDGSDGDISLGRTPSIGSSWQCVTGNWGRRKRRASATRKAVAWMEKNTAAD